MPDIFHRLPIRRPADAVFAAVGTPDGLNEWWTLDCEGCVALGAVYRFGFGAGYADWRGKVTALEDGRAIEWTMTHTDVDWHETVVSIRLESNGDRTILEFSHRGWRVANEHYRTTSCCWASYLRILRRYLEHGERVPYSARLDA